MSDNDTKHQTDSVLELIIEEEKTSSSSSSSSFDNTNNVNSVNNVTATGLNGLGGVEEVRERQQEVPNWEGIEIQQWEEEHISEWLDTLDEGQYFLDRPKIIETLKNIATEVQNNSKDDASEEDSSDEEEEGRPRNFSALTSTSTTSSINQRNKSKSSIHVNSNKLGWYLCFEVGSTDLAMTLTLDPDDPAENKIARDKALSIMAHVEAVIDSSSSSLTASSSMNMSTNYTNTSFQMEESVSQAFDSLDFNLPILYPIAGNVSFDVFSSIIDVLMTNVFPYSPFEENATHADTVEVFTSERLQPLDHIRCEMSFQKKAVVTRVSTGVSEVDLNRRICNRRTFRSDVVSLLSDIVTDFLVTSVGRLSNVKADGILIEPSHGDILYYEEGGMFNAHRDLVGKFPFGENAVGKNGIPEWSMYTLLVCLDSNITHQNLYRGDGNTVVYLPEQTFLQHIVRLSTMREEFFGDSIGDFENSKHSFTHSCEKGKFLLFPAEALHSSVKIMQKKGFKMALKLDVWIKADTTFNYKDLLSQSQLDELGLRKDGSVPIISSYMKDTQLHDPKYLYHYLIQNPHKCQCSKCESQRLKRDLYQKNLTKFLPFDINVCNVITEFVIGFGSSEDNKSHTKFGGLKSGYCSCHHCLPYSVLRFIDGYSSGSDDRYCNGDFYGDY